MIVELQDTEATEAAGADLWPLLPKKCIVYLQGELGAGKTTFVRGLLRAAGYQGVVKSPTYTVVEEYLTSDRTLFHFDLYRIRDPEELIWMGIEDYLAQEAVCLFEWPEMGLGILPEADLLIRLDLLAQGRSMQMEWRKEG
ncbi:tRNA (adenosine(37)-N6)-threonylcarbamoyltransferase complex ATPase subunit type 1 TsaE [Methylicorpusculum oleiharenae]|uniref:tRNA (adenosine(37)-N6)-threonylcarbamoyltransferase complex ATPase subunit type 1 TsaE n=1 Tax=Methylicorpusculum oleiharenae TaxID=1338687 RepID=UPI00135C531B|nr:tRNA (adenosine(37)-N6)-threonylcarbamoyltransferase complex ATPase subunit type 1 TsaE [Methylicorpusculum oleiharenae]